MCIFISITHLQCLIVSVKLNFCNFYFVRKPYQNVNRWFSTIVNQQQVKSVIGEVKLCDKAAEVDPKKYSEFQASLKGKEKFS